MNKLGAEQGAQQDNDNLKGKINILTPPYFLPSTDTGKNIQLVDNAFQEVHFKDLCNKHVDKKLHWIRWHDNASKFELQKIYNPGFYIDRGFNKEVVFESNKIGEILTGGNIGKFVFSGDIDEGDYENLSKILGIAKPLEPTVVLFVIKDQGAAREKFDKLDGTVHWLEVKGDDNNNKQIIWRNSKGCVESDVKNASMGKLRACVVGTDGPKNDLCKENDLLKAIEDKQAVIIADDPGMGKSTSLIKLCQQYRTVESPESPESPTTPWIINVSLKNCLQEVRSIEKSASYINISDIVGFLSKVGKNLDGKFAQKLLTSALDPNSTEKFPKPLLVTFDGFDEVLDQEGRDKIIELLKALKDKTRAKFWVTTRLQHKKSLENALSTFAVTFKPLDVDAQKLFIKKFFQDRISLLLPGNQMPNEERMNKYTAAFIEKMQSMFQGNVSSFIGTPLQLALLLESKGSIEACKKWAEEDNAVPDFAYLGNNILEVYENFIQGKYETYFKKIGVKQGEVQQATKDFCNSLHRNLAGALVSSSGSDKKVRRHKDMALSVGLIKPEDNKLCFIHPTFGEYFASRTYMDWIEKEPVFPNTNKHKHLLEKILIDKDYKVIRSFLNARLENKALPEETLKQYGKVISGLWEQRSGYTKEKTILHVAVNENNLEIITFLQDSLKEEPTTAKKFLLAKGSYHSNTACHLAAKSGNVAALQQLLDWAKEIGAGKDLLLAKDSCGNTAFHLAAKYGDIKVLQQLWDWAKNLSQPEPIDLKKDLLLAKNENKENALALLKQIPSLLKLKQIPSLLKQRRYLLHYLPVIKNIGKIYDINETEKFIKKCLEEVAKQTMQRKPFSGEAEASQQESLAKPMSNLLTQAINSFPSEGERAATTSALIPNTDQVGNILFQCGIEKGRSI
jgi:hypothetical protein